MSRLGAIAAAPFLGAQFVSLYRGATRMPTVPGKPVITSTLVDGGTTYVSLLPPPNDGGNAIISYESYIDGLPVFINSIGEGPEPGSLEAEFIGTAPAGSLVKVSAANAIGEGPLSDPVTVT